MTFKEVQDFFSSTNEFIVSDDGDYIKISYTGDDLTSQITSKRLYKPYVSIQQLIRCIKTLVWNSCNNIFD